MDEAQIFVGLKNNEKQAFDALFDLLYPQVRFFVEQIIKDELEAEDIAIQSLAKFWEKKADDFETLLQVRKFIFVVARNAAFNFLKKEKRQQGHHRNLVYETPEAEESLVEQNLYRLAMVQALLDEIEKLPDQCRETFKLVYIEKLPRPLVAERLHITPGTVNVHCANAMKKLRQVFSEKDLVILLAVTGIIYN